MLNMPVRVLKTSSGYEVYVDLEKVGSFPTEDDVNKFLEDIQRKITYFNWGKFWNGSAPAPDLPEPVYKALLKRTNVPQEEWEKYLRDIRAYSNVERSERAFLDLVARAYGEKPEYVVRVGELEYKFESLYKAEEFLEEAKKWSPEEYFKRLVKEKYGVELPSAPQPQTNVNVFRSDWASIVPPYPHELKVGTAFDRKLFEDYARIEKEAIKAEMAAKGLDVSLIEPWRGLAYSVLQRLSKSLQIVPENVPVLGGVGKVTGSISDFAVSLPLAATGNLQLKNVNPYGEVTRAIEEGKLAPWWAASLSLRKLREMQEAGAIVGEAVSTPAWYGFYGYAMPKLFGKLGEILDVKGFLEYEAERFKPLQKLGGEIEKIGEKLGIVEKRFYGPEKVELYAYVESNPEKGARVLYAGAFRGEKDVTDLVKLGLLPKEPRAGRLPLAGSLEAPYSPVPRLAEMEGLGARAIEYVSPKGFFLAAKEPFDKELAFPTLTRLSAEIDYNAIVKRLLEEGGKAPPAGTVVSAASRGTSVASAGGGLLSELAEKIAGGLKNVAMPALRVETKLKTDLLKAIGLGSKAAQAALQLPKLETQQPKLGIQEAEKAVPKLSVESKPIEVTTPKGLSLELEKPLKFEPEKPKELEGVPKIFSEVENKVKPVPVTPFSLPPVELPKVDQIVRDIVRDAVKEAPKATTKLDVPKLEMPTLRIPTPRTPTPPSPTIKLPVPPIGGGGSPIPLPRNLEAYVRKYWKVKWTPESVKLPEVKLTFEERKKRKRGGK